MRRIVSPLALMLAALAIPGLAARSAAAAGTTVPGTQLWVSRYGAPANDDMAFSIAVSPNGGTVYVTGTSFSGANYGKNATGTDYRTVAHNAATGARLWVARYNGPGNSTDDPYSLAVSPDGKTVYVTGASAGKSGFEYATVAYRATTGAQLWVARYGAPRNVDSEAHSIAVTPNGRAVYVTGYSTGISGYSYATIGYNAATGAQLWLRRYNGPGHGADRAHSLTVSPNGRAVYVTGESLGSGTGYDFATIAYKAITGAQLWLRRYNSPGNGDDLAESLAVSPDGSTVYVTGWSTPGYLTVA